MIVAALVAAITVGLALLELARRGVVSRRWPEGVLAVAAALCAIEIVQTVPARTLFAIAFYTGCLAVVALVAMVALWPILADLFDKPRRSRR